MKALNAIYWFNSLNSLAWSLIGIFIPVYLLTLGYSLGSIFALYLLDSAVVFFFSVIAGYLLPHLGFKKTLLAYLPFLAAFIASLYFVSEYNIPLWVIAVTSGIQTAFYFLPINVLFAQSANEEKMGASVGKLMGYSQIVSLAAPLIGGVLAAAGGFPALIAFAGLVFTASSGLLFLIPDSYPTVKFHPVKILWFLNKYARYAFVQTFQFFQQTLESVIWPIFIFLTFNDVFSVGFAGSLLGTGSLFFMMFVGKRADIGSKKKIFKTGAVIIAAIWICRFLVHGQLNYYLLTILAGFFCILISIPFNALTFNMSKKENIAEFMIFREFLLFSSRMMVFGLALLLINNLGYTFVAAAFSSLFFFLL